MMETYTLIANSAASTALAGVFLAASLAAIAITSAQNSSKRSALAAVAVALALATMWVLGQGLPASGMQLALAALVAITSISSVLDRLRPPATVLFSALVMACVLQFHPLFATMLPVASAASNLFMFLLIGCAAQLVLLAQLPLSPHRFSKAASRRLPEAPSLLRDGAQSTVLSSALALMLIELSEAHREAFAFMLIMSGLVSALAASAIACMRHHTFAVHAGLAAFPAGMCAVALLPEATLAHISASAALAGACTVWSREALVALRIDDASDLIAQLGVPLLVGWFAPAALNLALLAPQIQALGAMLLAAVMVGMAARGICQFLTGLDISSRAQAEGLDAKFAASDVSSIGAMR